MLVCVCVCVCVCVYQHGPPPLHQLIFLVRSQKRWNNVIRSVLSNTFLNSCEENCTISGHSCFAASRFLFFFFTPFQYTNICNQCYNKCFKIWLAITSVYLTGKTTCKKLHVAAAKHFNGTLMSNRWNVAFVIPLCTQSFGGQIRSPAWNIHNLQHCVTHIQLCQQNRVIFYGKICFLVLEFPDGQTALLAAKYSLSAANCSCSFVSHAASWLPEQTRSLDQWVGIVFLSLTNELWITEEEVFKLRL